MDHLKMIRAILQSPEVVQNQATLLFRRYDTNNNNLLDFEELSNACRDLNQQFGLRQADDLTMGKMLRKFDRDGDGSLNFQEFYQLYFRLLRFVRQKHGKFKVRADFFLEKQTGSPYDNYEEIKKLGEGTFGIATLVTDRRTQQSCVMKTVNKEKAEMPPEDLEQEILNLRQMSHPHIIKLFEYYEDYNNIYIIMEAACGGELLKVITENHERGFHVDETWAAVVMEQVLDGISYCHNRYVMHKDLKAENIMLLTDSPMDRPHAVVIDLGLAEMFKPGDRSSKVGGTPYTMAPEVWMSLAPDAKGFGPKCDVFSLGCVVFQLASGEVPFMARSLDPAEWLGILRSGPPMAKIAASSQAVQNIILSMLTFEEDARPTAAEARDHAWFKEAPATSTRLSAEQMSALCTFQEKNALEKAVLMQVASQMRARDLTRINAVFTEVDTDHSGFLDKEELSRALVSLGCDQRLAERAAHAADLDGDGRVDYSEFVAACISRCDARVDNMLWQAFVKIDKDGNNTLDRSELEAVLNTGEVQGFGLAPGSDELDEMWAQIDLNGDGRIEFDEFRTYFLRRLGLRG